MPTLKHLTCTVEWSCSNRPLEEFNTTYADGFVETYIAVPSTPTPFSVHLTSHGYIAPGLAMFVFGQEGLLIPERQMDGVYQCNRNRHNLRIPGEGVRRTQTEIDFRVRQKEELTWDGSFEGKGWRFEKVNIIETSPVVERHRAPYDGEYVGTIEVVVLRCFPSETPSSSATTPSSPQKSKVIATPDSSSDDDEESETDNLPTGGIFDGAAESNLAAKRKSKSKHISKHASKKLSLCLDGSWEDWFSENAAVLEAHQKKSKAGNAWGVQAPAEEGAYRSWINAPSTQNEPKTGTIDLSSANTGAWHPSGVDANTSKALAKTKQRIWANTFHSDWDRKCSRAGSDRGRDCQRYTSTTPDTEPVLQLRGGAPGSYAVSSGHATPNVIININNGPPPPSNWEAEAAKENTKWNGYKSPPVNDPWTLDLPAYDALKDPDANVNSSKMSAAWGNSKGQAQDNNDWGGNNDQSNAPGTWGNTAKNDDYSDNGNAWENPTNPTAWHAAKDYGQTIEDGWGNNRNHAQGDDCWGNNEKSIDNDEDQQNEDRANNGNDDGARQDSRWDNDNDNDNGNLQKRCWANDNDNRANDTWGAERGKAVTVGAKDPDQLAVDFWGSNSYKEASPPLSFGNSRAKSSKAGSTKSRALSTKSKHSAFNLSWVNKPSPSKAPNTPKPKLEIKTTSIPEAWSPPLAYAKHARPKSSSPSVKKASPKSSSPKDSSPKTPAPTPAQLHPQRQRGPVLSLSTAPKPKTYWSNWKGKPFTDELAKSPTGKGEPPIPESIEESVYAVPAEVARRSNLSHQVRPGKPAAYVHKKSTPRYMDTHEAPYAVFLFQYREKEIIEQLAQTTIVEDEGDEKQRLSSLSKNELIEKFMEARKELTSRGGSSDNSESATFKSNPNGVLFGPDLEKLNQKLERLETGQENGKEAVAGWLRNAGGDNGDENAGGDGGVNDNNENAEDTKGANANGNGGDGWFNNRKNGSGGKKDVNGWGGNGGGNSNETGGGNRGGNDDKKSVKSNAKDTKGVRNSNSNSNSGGSWGENKDDKKSVKSAGNGTWGPTYADQESTRSARNGDSGGSWWGGNNDGKKSVVSAGKSIKRPTNKNAGGCDTSWGDSTGGGGRGGGGGGISWDNNAGGGGNGKW